MIDKPLYRVAAAGLDPRDARLIEIVFRHSQYNRYEFRLVEIESFDAVDILIVNTVETSGLRALARMRTLGRDIPVVAAVPRGAPSSAKHAISIDRLTLQLLPILNRVVEAEFDDPETRPMLLDAENESLPAAELVEAAAVAAGFQATQPVPTEARQTAPVAAPLSQQTRHGLVPGADANSASESDRYGPRVAPPRTDDSILSASVATPRHAPARPAPVPQAHQPLTPARKPRPADETMARVQAPAAPSSAERARPPAPHDTGSSVREDAFAPPAMRIRILIVDDSPTVRTQLSIALGRMGALCDTVENAVDGLTRMQDVRYDLVLVDVVMPEIDGYKLTREIRRRHRGIPVIILTSRSSPFDLARGALAGCSTYLVKPVTLRKLETAVVKVLRKTLAIDDLTGLLRPISMYASPRAGAPGSGKPRGSG